VARCATEELGVYQCWVAIQQQCIAVIPLVAAQIKKAPLTDQPTPIDFLIRIPYPFMGRAAGGVVLSFTMLTPGPTAF
jgi:hypothetical protein